MLSDLNLEVHFIFYLTLIIITSEIIFYIIHKALKIKGLKLLIYKILLPLVLLIGFEVIVSITLLINNFLITDPSISNIISIISLILTLLTLISFIFIISLNIISINPTIQKIKIKIIPIIIGQILIILSLFIEILILNNIFSIILLSIGIGLIFFSIYSGNLINAFLNIKGSEKLSSFYIINSMDNRCLYYYNFTQKEQNEKNGINFSGNSFQKIEDLFFSHGIEGIEKIIALITDTQDEKIKSISQEKSLILLEHDSKFKIPLTYVLIAYKEQKNMRYLLNTFKNQFESFYKEILANFEVLNKNQALVFSSFDIIVQNIVK